MGLSHPCNVPATNAGARLASLLATVLLVVFAAAPVVADDAVAYEHITDDTPWSIHVVRFDLSDERVEVHATMGGAVSGLTPVAEMVAHVASVAAGDGGEWWPVAAVNGDYYEVYPERRYLGVVAGTSVVRGELVAGPVGTVFWIDGDGRPRIGRVRGDAAITWPGRVVTPFRLNIATSDHETNVARADVVMFTPKLGASTLTDAGREIVLERATDAAGEGDGAGDDAWPPLAPGRTYTARVRAVHDAGDTPIPPDAVVVSIAQAAESDGRVPAVEVGDVVTFTTASEPDLAGATTAVSGGPILMRGGEIIEGLNDTARHPRTAVGFAGSEMVLVVVDGRQAELSVGMTLHELAELMQRLGCTDAMNLDGGGSSTFWYAGEIRNSPSASRRVMGPSPEPRPVANALVVMRRGE
jgi:large repetitive protein